MDAVQGDSRKAGIDVSSDFVWYVKSVALHNCVAWLRGKTGMRHRFRGKANQFNWEWAVALDAVLARLDAARSASWRQSHVGAQGASKIALGSAVVRRT